MNELASQRIMIAGVSFHPVTVDQLHQEIAAAVRDQLHKMVLHVNVHGINLAQGDLRLRAIVNQADLVFCDGFGVRLGARVLGYTVPPRITYADWLWQLAEFASAQGLSLFLLGSKPGVAEQARDALVARHPQLRIAGTHHGYFDQRPESADSRAVISQINAVRPDILLVCFGMPLQEYWLSACWAQIDARVGLTGGAALDYASGQLQRGPRWMTGYGLEWLARVLIEPRRLWQRYILGNPAFLWRVLLQRIGRVGDR